MLVSNSTVSPGLGVVSAARSFPLPLCKKLHLHPPSSGSSRPLHSSEWAPLMSKTQETKELCRIFQNLSSELCFSWSHCCPFITKTWWCEFSSRPATNGVVGFHGLPRQIVKSSLSQDSFPQEVCSELDFSVSVRGLQE